MFKRMISRIMVIALIIGSLAFAPSNQAKVLAGENDPGDGAWDLEWSDEFDGDSLNTDIWSYDKGKTGWGNNEVQNYTDSDSNVFVEDGKLNIRVDYNSGQGFTSGRIKTDKKKTFKHGKIEARIKVDGGNQKCIWPAFWMLGNDYDEVGWPASGELDIMEHSGIKSFSEGTIHWGPDWDGKHSWGSFSNGKYFYYDDNENNGINGWHTYGIVWNDDKITWYVDDESFLTASIGVGSEQYEYFNKEYFILLNLAVGGPSTSYTGNYNPSASLAGTTMLVDYVRTYKYDEELVTKEDPSGETKPTSGSCGDNVNWNYDKTERKLTLTGSGAMSDFTYNTCPWKEYSKYIKTVEIGDDITSIGSYAFYGCTRLKIITLPSSINKIGGTAFNSSGITYLQIPNSVNEIGSNAFGGCESLTTLILPNNMESIPSFLCNRCSKLKSVNIPSNVKEISSSAFFGCESLTNIDFPSGLESIGEEAFSQCLKLESVSFGGNIKNIEYGAFSQCEELVISSLPSSLETVGDYAFEGCKGITNINVSASLTSIGYHSFNCDCTNISVASGNTAYDSRNNCNALIDKSSDELIKGSNSSTIPNTVKSIASYAFADCRGLTKISIPNSVKDIGEFAFVNCIELSDLIFGSGVENIGYGAFRNCQKLKTVVLPDSVQSVQGSTFDNCSSLEEVVLSSALDTIPADMFYKCVSLEKIDIAEGIQTIESNAFECCSKLQTLYIPKTVTKIEEGVFKDCSNLESIVVDEKNTVYDSRDESNSIIKTSENYLIKGCKNTVIPSTIKHIGYGAFSNCKEITNIIIPKGVEYIDANAFEGCSNIKEIDFPRTLKQIMQSSFKDCDGLTSITLKKELESINPTAFQYCDNIAQLSVESGNKYYDSRDNCNGIILKSTKELVIGCKNTVIPTTVEKIGQKAFHSCTALTEYSIPEGVKTISDAAFYECTNLKTIKLPSTLTDIKSYAFYGCSNLETIKIPDKVKNIAWETFSGCSNLKKVRMPDNISSITYNAFDGCSSELVITVLEGSYAQDFCVSNHIKFRKRQPIVTGQCGTNVYWSFDQLEHELTISGKGYMYDYYYKSTVHSFAPYANEIYSVIVEEGVENIGGAAFYATYKNLRKVTLPYSLKSIDSAAFQYCSALGEIIIPSKVTHLGIAAFHHCTNLKKVYLPDGINDIESSAFSGDSKAEYSVLAGSYGEQFVKEMGYKIYETREKANLSPAMPGTRLPSYTPPVPQETTERSIATGIVNGTCGTNANYSFNTDTGILVISGTGVLNISCADIENTTGRTIKKIEIGEGITETGIRSFSCCSNLVEVKLPSTLEKIDTAAFDGCQSLENIELPDTLKTIEDYAFSRCENIKKVTLPGNLEKIGSYAFERNKRDLLLVVEDDSYAETWAKKSGFNYMLKSEETTTPEPTTTSPGKVIDIDGNKQYVSPGGEFTFPTNAKYGFYTADYNTIYAPGETVTVTDDISVKPFDDLSFSMSQGASIRLDGTSGIKFQAVAARTTQGADLGVFNSNAIECGTLITTADMYYETYAEQLSLERYNKWIQDGGRPGTIKKISNANGWAGTPGTYATGIMDVYESNWIREFMSVGYIKFTFHNGTTKEVYTKPSSVRSIRMVALAIRQAGYPGLTSQEKSIVDNYIAKSNEG